MDLTNIHVSWGGFAVTTCAFVLILFLRRLLPKEKAKRGRWALLFLALSLVLRLALTIADNAGYQSSVLELLATALMSFGLTGTGAMLLFDVILGRLKVPVPVFLRDIVQGIVFGIVAFAAMRAAGVDPVGMVTTSAVLTAVIGLALQSTISNLFAGFALQLDRTITVGDWVQVSGRIGRVTQIKWRSTFLVTLDGDNVILPNGNLLSNEVLNFTKPTPEHRHTIKIGIHYKHPPNEVKRVLLGALRGVPGVIDVPAPDCLPMDFADSAITYHLRYWINDYARDTPVEGEVRTRIWYATQRAGMEIPFPIRTVHMTEMTVDKLSAERQTEYLERVAALAKIDLFSPLDQQQRERVAESMRKVSFAGGELIIRQGDPGDSLYVIQDGEVAVRFAVEGAEREVAALKAGEFFGEMSLVTGEPRRATCAARRDVECYVIDHTALSSILAEKPQVAEQISSILGARQTALEGERENLSAEARAKRAAEHGARLLSRIRDFFNLG